MNTFYPFPKIYQMRQAVKNLRKMAMNRAVQQISFHGTPKIHGTNAGIVVANGKVTAQSRTRSLTPDNDNYQFATFVDQHADLLARVLPDNVVYYGEWCGNGIQKNVAVSQLSRRLVIFAARTLDDRVWHRPAELINDVQRRVLADCNIFTIDMFPSYSVDVDVDCPSSAVEEIEKIVERVEQQCPVGLFFGVDGVGEGVVWTPMDDELFNDTDLWFKTKGDKHQATKTKQKIELDPLIVSTRQEFVQSVVTDVRLKQAADYVREIHGTCSVKHTADFLRWIAHDIQTEERDTMEANDIAWKDVAKAINGRARTYWMRVVED